MANFFPYIQSAYKECEDALSLVLECLEEEKQALVSLEMEKIIQTNLKKEGLTSRLKRKQRDLRVLMNTHYGVENFSALTEKLEPPEAALWQQNVGQWKNLWEQVTSLSRQNQSFIQHSLRNLGLIVENLKRLFGQPATYSAKGQKIDPAGPGKVVEARY